MTKLVIFGTGEIAQLAQYYFTHDSDHEVVGFTVDADYATETEAFGLPLVSFDEVATRFPPGTHEMFIALSYTGLNKLRTERYLAAKAAGYKMASYISSRATVLNDGHIGDNAFIFEDNTIQPYVTIGSNVTIWSGNHIGHHSTIGDHTFVSSHVVVSGGVTIGQQCFLGVNATIRNGLTIGDRCVVGAGAILLKDAEPEGVYLGPETERSRVPSTRLRGI